MLFSYTLSGKGDSFLLTYYVNLVIISKSTNSLTTFSVSQKREGWTWFRCCSYSVWICDLYYGVLYVLKAPRALCHRVSSFLLALLSPRLGKRELVCVLLVYSFVCFVRVSFFFLFLLVSRVGCGL